MDVRKELERVRKELEELEQMDDIISTPPPAPNKPMTPVKEKPQAAVVSGMVAMAEFAFSRKSNRGGAKDRHKELRENHKLEAEKLK